MMLGEGHMDGVDRKWKEAVFTHSELSSSLNMASEPVQDAYEPKAPLSRATTAGLQAGAVGAFVSAVQNALSSHSAGAAGFLTRTGGSIGTFGESL